MGREVLETGKIHVWRGQGTGCPDDAEEIRSIRKGAWTYEALIEWAEKEDAALNKMYAQKAYVVPHSPDRKKLDALCLSLLEAGLSTP